jgi:class 3 adenylate cyclase
VHDLGLDIRSALHTGEIEILPNDVGGIAVYLAARVAQLAGPGEVLTSSVLKELVAGSGLRFEDRSVMLSRGWRTGQGFLQQGRLESCNGRFIQLSYGKLRPKHAPGGGQ